MKNCKRFLACLLCAIMLMSVLPMAVSAVNIPSDAVKFNGHYYKAYYSPYTTFIEAKDSCERFGGHLVTITSQKEQDFIYNNLICKHPAAFYWIGASDIEEEGVWKWITGEKWDYENWGVDIFGRQQPDNCYRSPSSNYGGESYENYACIVGTLTDHFNSHGIWNDVAVTADVVGSDSCDRSKGGYICEWENIYDMKDETYSFKNYTDVDSEVGHCFGMAVTSSAYYLGLLDYPSETLNTYSLPNNSTTQRPICDYQAIQGNYKKMSIVSGGHFLFDDNDEYDIESDWRSLIEYVENHEYDDRGNLILNFWVKDGGGHAVNFLRYENVDGQDRVYVYDNNFPDTETYFYQKDGKIYQAPKSTFTKYLFFKKSIDSVALVDVETYLSYAIRYRASLAVYSEAGNIEIANAYRSVMAADDVLTEYYMYELPDDITEVTIKPLKPNAEFRYMDKVYTFSEVDENTVGVLKLAESDSDEAAQQVEFTISGAPEKPSTPETKPCTCKCHSSGFSLFIWKIGNFFHRIFRMNKYRECPCGNKMHW